MPELGANPSIDSRGNRGASRSRGACWTCKDRHKKCDETRPVCQRCERAGIDCKGYDLRLTWGKPKPGTSKTGGTLLDPCRSTRKAKSSASTKAAPKGQSHSVSASSSVESPSDRNSVSHWSPISFDLDLTSFRREDESASENGRIADDETEARLMEKFSTDGYLTLTGRSPGRSLLYSDVIPLCSSCKPLRDVCLAYQAGLEGCEQLKADYLQRGLSGYLRDLSDNQKLNQDSTLATGIILCSISITSAYIWTPLSRGSFWLLQQRGLLNPDSRSRLTSHLVEVIGIIDIPYFTIHRTAKSLSIWTKYVAPHVPYGVEEMSGLPYSLVNLIARLEEPGIDQELASWPGHPCQELPQMHLWEAFRVAAMLHGRALQRKNSEDADISPAVNSDVPSASDEVLLMKVFASIQALVNSEVEKFLRPLSHYMVYPLSIASLLTADGSNERAYAREVFHHLMKDTQILDNRLIWNMILEVWEREKLHPSRSKLEMAVEFAAEMNVELYLY